MKKLLTFILLISAGIAAQALYRDAARSIGDVNARPDDTLAVGTARHPIAPGAVAGEALDDEWTWPTY